MKTIIIDYGMGNLRSVQKAIEYIGESAEISSDIKIIEKADRLILPGVGAFNDAINGLNSSGIAKVIKDKVADGTPILGICLGMQLMYEKSFEDGEYEGLGIIKGSIKKFVCEDKIPHMGWNNIIKIKTDFTDGISDNSQVYFVHSYYADISNVTDTYCEYSGIKFSASIHQDNIFATQFHPEKSSKIGLKILQNFFKQTEA